MQENIKKAIDIVQGYGYRTAFITIQEKQKINKEVLGYDIDPKEFEANYLQNPVDDPELYALLLKLAPENGKHIGVFAPSGKDFEWFVYRVSKYFRRDMDKGYFIYINEEYKLRGREWSKMIAIAPNWDEKWKWSDERKVYHYLDFLGLKIEYINDRIL